MTGNRSPSEDSNDSAPISEPTRLDVLTPGRHSSLDITINRSFIEPACDLSDLEIAGFAIHAALSPWIRRIEVDRDARIGVQPRAPELMRAISAFTHSGPTFQARLGAVTVRATQANSNPLISFSIPDGSQSIAGNHLLSKSIRDHWAAHRSTAIPASAMTMSANRGRPMMKLAIGALIAATERSATLQPDSSFEPELFWRAVHKIAPACEFWPRTPHETWHATRLAETVAIAKGWLREDPTGVDGFRWRPGPKWSEHVNEVPRRAIDAAARLLAESDDVGSVVLDAFCFTFAEEIGGEYFSSSAFSCSEPSAHARISAATLADAIDIIGMEIAGDPTLKSWLLSPLRG